jgi:LmbE family N-acetylglucosaminyl deacetylase
MRITTVLAHPDDAELWAGGTLLQHSRRGDDVDIFTFADAGSERRTEAETGARLLGARCHLEDRSFFNSPTELAACVMRFLEATAPDVVITHWARDTHFEHAAVWQAVSRCMPQTKIEYGKPCMLLSCDTYGSIGLDGVFEPTLYIDVSSVFDRKLDALKAHASQPTARWIEMAQSLGALHGMRSGCRYAEAFIDIPVLGLRHAWKLLPRPNSS